MFKRQKNEAAFDQVDTLIGKDTNFREIFRLREPLELTGL